MVSNCQTYNMRSTLYEKLRKFLKIDVFGDCGNMTCLKTDQKECYDMLEKNYKFYLSFENSNCKDYVTEKLYNILKKNLVPIVYGGANYEKLVPPNSVIDISTFKTIKDLIKYIQFLDDDPKEYLKYFRWKTSYVIDTSNKYTLCKLCEKLNNPIIEQQSYFDIVEWWNFPEVCKYGNKLPKILFT